MPQTPLSSRVIRASLDAFLRANILWAAFGICTVGALYTGMLLSLGMNQKQIGLLMSLPLLTLPMQIAGAVLQQRYFNRKKFWVSAQVFYLSMFALMAALVAAWPTLPPGWATSFFIAVLLLANLGFQLSRPVQLAWQSDIVPEREMSVFWNRLTAQGIVASVVTGFAMGWVADRLGRENRLAYVLLLGIGLVFATVSLRTNARVPDPDPDPHAEGGVLEDVLAVLRSPGFRRLSTVFSLQSVAGWLCSAFIFVHLQRTMQFSMVQMQVLAGISCAVSFAAGRLFEIVGKHYGRKPVLLICTLVKSVEFVFWGTMRPGDHALDHVVRRATTALLGDWAALPEGFASVIPAFVLGGFVNVGIASMQLAFMRSIGTRRTQSLAIGLFFFVVRSRRRRGGDVQRRALRSAGHAWLRPQRLAAHGRWLRSDAVQRTGAGWRDDLRDRRVVHPLSARGRRFADPACAPCAARQQSRSWRLPGSDPVQCADRSGASQRAQVSQGRSRGKRARTGSLQLLVTSP